VITTVFSTPCLKSARLSLALWLAGILMLIGGLPSARAEGNPVEITRLQVERAEDGVFLTAQIKLELPTIVEDALSKGVAMFFVAEADLLRDRWYWYDRKVSTAARHIRLAYQPLTRRWRINVSPEPIGNVGLGVSITQNFDSLDDALQSVQRISRWKIAEAGTAEPEARHSVEFRFRLDMSQLPRPFQIGVVGQPEWNLAAARSVRLNTEASR
jgi:hypothetical protein